MDNPPPGPASNGSTTQDSELSAGGLISTRPGGPPGDSELGSTSPQEMQPAAHAPSRARLHHAGSWGLGKGSQGFPIRTIKD